MDATVTKSNSVEVRGTQEISGKPRTWVETVRKDLKVLNLTDKIAFDQIIT